MQTLVVRVSLNPYVSITAQKELSIIRFSLAYFHSV